MYTPKHFEQNSIETMHNLIRAFPLATLITQGSHGITVNHIPMHLSNEPGPNGLLSGHVPRANPVWQEFDAEKNAVVVFQGAQSYITPSWYVSKKQHGKVVPTWNYTAVHAHGRLNVIHDSQWLLSHLELLTDQLESNFAHPWSVTDAPRSFTEKLLDHLIGIEIPIEKLEGKWKVSQNRSIEDRIGVADGLKDKGGSNDLLMSELVGRDPS